MPFHDVSIFTSRPGQTRRIARVEQLHAGFVDAGFDRGFIEREFVPRCRRST